MTIRVYFAAPRWDDYRAPLDTALEEAGVTAEVSPDCPDPSTVDYIVYAPGGPLSDFRPFVAARAVLSLWAGVERIVSDPTLTQPLCRMVDDGLREGMTEYVAGHVLRHHLGIDRYIGARDWAPVVPPLARDRIVTVLGLGELGAASAAALVGLGFAVRGWSRRARNVPGVTCYSGDAGLDAALAGTDIVVTLLPLTAGTENVIDARRLQLLASGAVLINPGRGALIDDAALLEALETGQVSHATLDVFRIEPLPDDHPFRGHPGITVTPHVAAETRPGTAARVIAENIRRGEAGEPFLYRVDRAFGY